MESLGVGHVEVTQSLQIPLVILFAPETVNAISTEGPAQTLSRCSFQISSLVSGDDLCKITGW